MSKWIIIPADVCARLCERRYAPAPKTAREAALPEKHRALYGLYGVKLLNRPDVCAIPADVLDHDAYAEVREELGKHPIEDLAETDFDVPKMEMPK